MRAVVDTNVVAYYLLGTPGFAEETRAFWARASDLLAPALWEAEIANVLWMATRAGALAPADAAEKLSLAGRLGIESVPNRRLWHGAFVRSVRSGAAVYDTLFVELAARERLPLVTFDARLSRAWPRICRRPGSKA